MIRENVSRIAESVSGERLTKTMDELTSFHRIQASEGYSAAAEYCQSYLQEAGIASEIIKYPAQYGKWYLTMPSFETWECERARLELVAPISKTLADFSLDKLAVFQKSFPCYYMDEPVEIMMLDPGSNPEDYQEIDLKGKLIFVRDAFTPYLEWAIEKRGAIGIVSDFVQTIEGISTRETLMDIRKYHTFWWNEAPVSAKPFGFVLTPKEGDALAALCREMDAAFLQGKSEKRYPRAKCQVVSRFYEGTVENVTALLKGASTEEILLTAHLCHPAPSANDNASGVSAVMETLCALKRMIDEEILPPLKRSIRILLIPEFTGVYAYLQKADLAKTPILSGLNLDMVAGRQDKGYGPLTLSGLPKSTPSFVMDLGAMIMDELKRETPGFTPQMKVPLFNSAVVEFSSGSDNFILSDPSIGIPTPMLGQWPDIFYHTSGDTLEIISVSLLKKSTTLAAAYAYTLATLKSEDLPIVFRNGYFNMQWELCEAADRAISGKNGPVELYEIIKHIKDYRKDACRDALRYFSGDELERAKYFVGKEMETIERSVDLWMRHQEEMGLEQSSSTIKEEDQKPSAKSSLQIAENKVPMRKYKAPINQLSLFAKGKPEWLEAMEVYNCTSRKCFANAYYAELLTQYYVDGKNSVGDIARKVSIDCREAAVIGVDHYLVLLEQFGLIEWC